MRPTQLQTFLERTLPAGLPVCVTGRPGIGKTDIITNACQAIGYDLMICHPPVDDPIDYKGLPGVVEGTAEFLPYGNLRAMMQAEKPLVVFFDDLGQAPESVQKAIMQLLLAREINGQKISDQVIFLAATNRKEDKAGVTGLLEPVKSRFAAIVELSVHTDDWIAWATRHTINPTVIAFVKYRPNTLHEFKPTKDMTNSPCPRTLARLSHLTRLELPEALRMEAYGGAVGDGTATEYLAFEKMASQLLPASEILKQPKQAKLPPRDAPDVCYATAAGLAIEVNYERMPALITYLDRYDEHGAPEYAVLCLRMMQARDESLTQHPEWIRWASAHRPIIV